jgi:hypothetical protein
VAEYRIVTARRRDSDEPMGYFDRWHAIVFLGKERIGFGQGFTLRRAERRARSIAREHQRKQLRRRGQLREVRETPYELP